MMSPLLAVVAPWNSASVLLMVEERLTQLKALVSGSKIPTQLALCGAKIMSPLLALVAPLNLAPI